MNEGSRSTLDGKDALFIFFSVWEGKDFNGGFTLLTRNYSCY